MRLFALAMWIAAAGCGGPDETCQSEPCGVSSQMYKVCTAAGTTHVQYQFGGKNCDCDGTACTDCASQVASWCRGDTNRTGVGGGGNDGGVVPGMCVAGGGSCQTFRECCSQTCAANVCTMCGTTGATCATNSDCCPQPGLGFICLSGKCQASCRADGSSCNGPSDCCGNICSAGVCKSPVAMTSCSATLNCYNACMDQTCIDNCYANESPKGKALDDNLYFGCPARTCNHPQDGGATPCTSSEVSAIEANTMANVSQACSDCMGNVDIQTSCKSELAACMADK
jgi:hypothetical protein